MGTTSIFEIDEEFVKSRIPPRRRDSHKGMNGVVCVVGGSRTYHGAPFLCAMGAARTGVDLVYLAVPAMVATPVRSLSPDLIVFPLPDSKLTRGNASRLASWLPEMGCMGIGPGLGPQNPNELKNALATLSGKCQTLVVDADALRPQVLDGLDERVAVVKKAAGDHGVVVLMKGPTDVVSDGERVGLNYTHSPAMTVGGTGDVLTGVTSGLAAKGM